MPKRLLTKQERHYRAVARNEIKRAIGTLPEDVREQIADVTLAFVDDFVVHPELQGIDPVNLSSVSGPTEAQRKEGMTGETVITVYLGNILHKWHFLEFIVCEQAAQAYLAQIERYVGIQDGRYVANYFR